MRTVPRHNFVPPNLLESAYEDNPLPIGYGQTISQPYIVAYMTAAIDPKPHFKVLEIGTGSGYQAAVLSEIVKETYTIEIITELYSTASKRLSVLGYNKVHCKNADGYYGWEKYAPFDAIVVTAAAEYIPPPLIEQLKDGGKMIIPVGSPFLNQSLILVEKDGEGITTTNLLPVRFVPFTRDE
jgi:protein-L-isoaspartate(D-aspartate) O-methyltransferase